MKYFLAVVPPIELAMQIELFRAQWGQPTLPAHITVKAPNSLSDENLWLPAVQSFCQDATPIAVQLDGIGHFSSTVVYWRVESAGLVALHQSLLAIINPPEPERIAYFEGSAYVPHLTLAHLSNGTTTTTLSTVYEQATQHWLHPVDFIAQTLRVFRSSGPNQTYEMYMDLPLSGKSSSF
ncbi:2'-5' RNA ligase family protein [Hymenobacter arizonensis]|uniref:2'-5' RNA ligase n=1 Tax=Hymenobacter arizonensis TaxID=1227077 RepID=A0A1I6BML1_HYMAR|nr:2'-5' RNA ligase family protein [Hymenobacter arizonensis]SFQ82179.1 2'-5' RNA ligase [Hymenobacter arizonensis]